MFHDPTFSTEIVGLIIVNYYVSGFNHPKLILAQYLVPMQLAFFPFALVRDFVNSYSTT